MPDSTAAKSFEDVRNAEAQEIGRARRARRAQGDKPQKTNAPPEGEPASQLVGLAFSGGGIRSATFNLGVVQGLANLGLLPIFDYLSTVSGGGYIGTWLTAWIRRRGLPEVETGLKTKRADRGNAQEPSQIRFLREYSNYLTPKLGLASGDTWAFVGAYIRNLLLNQIILVLVLISLLLLSRPFLLYFWMIAGGNPSIWKLPLAAAVLLGVALGTSLANLSSQAQQKGDEPAGKVLADPWQIDLLVVLPTLAALWLLWAWWWGFLRAWERYHIPGAAWHLKLSAYPCWWVFLHPGDLICGTAWGLPVVAGVSFMVLWAAGWIGGEFVRWLLPKEKKQPGRFQAAFHAAKMAVAQAGFPVVQIILWAGIPGVIGGFLSEGLTREFEKYATPGFRIPEWHFASWGFPVVVFIFLFVQTLHIGLVGKGFTEDAREWWGRLGGILSLMTLCLSALFFISLDGTWAVGWLGQHHVNRWVLASLWAAITGTGVVAGKAPVKSDGGVTLSPSLAAKVAPPVFVLGLLLILSMFTNTVLPNVVGLAHGWLGSWTAKVNSLLGTWPSPISDAHSSWGRIESTLDGCLWIYIALFFGAALFLSWREGINRFSMHSLYRNRLVRCYLGASNDQRDPQPFTGMDPKDDSILFGELLADGGGHYAGPFPVYNTTLNLLSTKNLAWQQRKGASFVFTPIYSGFEFVSPKGERISALRETSVFEKKLKLGLAMAISGAAASPNMGSHSTPALSFLMTVFNVRLGWWLGNPLYPPKIWGSMGPGVGLFYLIFELMGHTTYTNRYVYLSDGGHFENLGVYELVRRRCRFIVVCDSGEDHALHFGDLGNAIEKCRTDFGVDIEIDIEPLRRQKDSGNSKWHCAVGTIHYEMVDSKLPSGTLLYMKPTLTGDEPTDVQRYADQCPAFPHQSTADQWFNESQFESYRALGQHIVESTIGVIGDRKEMDEMDIEGLFVELRQHWYPPSRFVQASFTKHTATYSGLLERMRTNKDLEFLDAQIYPEWPSLIGTKLEKQRAAIWLPAKASEKRAGFYFCNELIQLMEDAYLDLNLEADFDHPDNRGWMNLFRHWSWSGMFCATWAISAGIYGARFQNFCGRHLDLHPGKVGIRNSPVKWQPGMSEDEETSFWSRAETDHGIDFWEAELIRLFIQEGWYGGPDDKMTAAMRQDKELALSHLYIIPFDMVVESPRKEHRQKLQFNVGFALALIPDPDGARADIVYFRIQDHMRKMGLARAALGELMRQYGTGLRNGVHPTLSFDGREQLPGGASKWEAYPSGEAAQKFADLFESVKLHLSQMIGS